MGNQRLAAESTSIAAAGRVVRNQALVRRANEEIHMLDEGRSQRRRVIGLICECSRQGCLSPIAVPLADYETLRADHRHYLIAPGHIWDETSEQIVVRTDMFWILRRTESAPPNQ